MAALLKVFFRIGTLTAKPQDLPASSQLLGVVIAVELATSYAVDTIHPDATVRLLAALTQSSFLALWLWLALAVRQRPARWLQTATALYGTSTIVTVVAWALFGAVRSLHGAESGIVLLAAWVISLWALAIMSHVLRHALEVSIGIAALITVAYAIIGGIIMISFPTG